MSTNPFISIAELDRLYEQLNVEDKGRPIVEAILNSGPARNVAGTSKNYTGRFASLKMGRSISVESRNVELAFAITYEHDDSVYVFLDQPGKLHYEYTVNGKKRGHIGTPDYFLISEDFIGWVECKTEEKLLQEEKERPHLYSRDENGNWHFHPGEAYAQKFGLGFKVVSSADLNWNVVRNGDFLGDYTREDCPTPDKEVREAIHEYVSREQGIFAELILQDLSNIHPQATADDLYWMLTHNELYFDMFEQSIQEPDRTNIYTDDASATAHYLVRQAVPHSDSSVLVLEVGCDINWDGNRYRISNIGDTRIFLSPADSENSIVELRFADLEKLIAAGQISGVDEQPGIESAQEKSLHEFLNKASLEAKQKALDRLEIRDAVVRGEKPKNTTLSPRAIRDLVRRCKEAEIVYGTPLIGAFTRDHLKGNRLPKLPEQALELMKHYIKTEYMVSEQPTAISVFQNYHTACEREGIKPASYQTFCQTISKTEAFEREHDRSGDKAAADFAAWHWELSQKLPKHGIRPFAIVHIDHTPLDILLVSKATGKILGKPWCTFAVCAFSRRILAVFLTYKNPSRSTLMMTIREMVRRFNRIGDTVIVDWGAEFRSTQFEVLLALHGTTKLNRPKGRPRFGSVIERLFGTTRSEFISRLAGNTQIYKLIRKMSRAVDPANTATWTIQALTIAIRYWAYEIYDTEEHPALGQSPREAFEQGLKKTGDRPNRRIVYNQNFIQATLPEVRGGDRLVRSGGIIKVDYINYSSKVLESGSVEGTKVDVIYDPSNAGSVWAHVKGKWEECRCQEYARLNGRSWDEIHFITEELSKRHANISKQRYTPTERAIAYFEAVGDTQTALEELRDINRENLSAIKTEGLDFSNPDDRATLSGFPAPDVNASVPDGHDDSDDVSDDSEFHHERVEL